MLSYSVQVRCLSDRCESDSVKVTDFKAADIKFGRNQFVFVKMTDVLKGSDSVKVTDVKMSNQLVCAVW